uniref:Transmembrane protein n=1 Tax=Steinernema glaseri TaxID=37863 RepID=A0A1I7YVB7_9BILA
MHSKVPSPLADAGRPAAQVVASKELIKRYIGTLSKKEIVSLLQPVKDGLLTEDTVLHLNTVNFSIDHMIIPLTVNELVEELGAYWQRWMHSAPNVGIDPRGSVHYLYANAFHNVEMPASDYVTEFVNGLSKRQKRALLTCAQDGLLTDESFVNVSHFTGPDRMQVSMLKVVDIIGNKEAADVRDLSQRHWIVRFMRSSHYSSGNFEAAQRADLNVRTLRTGRQSMSVWYTVLFALMTVGTFASHVWSNITNFLDMQAQLKITGLILAVSSAAIGALIYLVFYMVGFLFCCENSFSKSGLKSDDDPSCRNRIYKHFSALYYFEYRIYATKVLQFILLWYTMLLSVYAHENRLNIYPALSCVLTNGFGLMLFSRIARFFHACREGEDKKTIIAR